MQTITRKLWFSAGHRVYGHEGHCKNLHGHNYVLHVTAQAPDLDSLGRVIDFSVLKDRFDSWIQKNWDHGFLWFQEDRLCRKLYGDLSWLNTDLLADEEDFDELHEMKSFVCPFNPTAENMARFLLDILGPEVMYGTEVTIVQITIFETENCWATASLQGT